MLIPASIKSLSKEEATALSKKLAKTIITKIAIGVVVTVSVSLISAQILGALANDIEDAPTPETTD